MVAADYPFVGRRDELLRIRAAGERVRRGQSQFVVLEGLAGVGKTELMRRARDSFPEWPEYGVVLSRHQRATHSAVLHGLLEGSAVACDEASVEEIAAKLLRGAQEFEAPMIVSIGELHHADDFSAELLWQVLSTLVDSPVLVLMSAAPSARPEIRRLAQLAQVSPQGTHIALAPLTLDDVKDYLGICTGFAVSREAAARVHRATDGYPLLVRCVGSWLQSTPMGRRGIDQAIRHALEHEDLLHIRTQLDISLEGVGEPTGRVLDILATAETPISERNLESILGERICPRELVQTGMVRWDDASCGYALRMRAAGRGLIGRLSCKERRDLHLALAAVLSGRESMHHQVAAAQLDPEAVAAERLHEQLVEAGREAAEAGDCGEAFELVRLSARLRPDVEGLTRLGLLAVSADRRKDLVEFEPAVRALPASAGRSALLAMLSIQRADPQGALKELDRRTDLSGEESGLLLYAQTLSDVCGHLILLGGAIHPQGTLSRTLEAVERHQERLRSERAKQLSSGQDIEPAWDLGYAAGLHGMLTVWRTVEGISPKSVTAGLQTIAAHVELLKKFPGTERPRAILRSLRGTRMAQFSEHREALGELTPLTNLGGTDAYSLQARAQTALLLFNAGKWREAHETAEAAAGEALLDDENGASLLAYALTCLVPAARGQVYKVQPVIRQLEEAPLSGPLVEGVLCTVKAWAAISEGAHSEAAQHLLSARSASSGWWLVGLEPLLLLARELHCSEWSELLPGLMRSASQDVPSLVGSQLAVLEYLKGFESWGQGEPGRAMESFVRTLKFFDRQPPLQASQAAVEGGGFRLLRAMMGLDMAALFVEHREALPAHRSLALEMVVWSASVFQACGSQTLFEAASELMDRVRTRRSDAPAPPTSPIQAPPVQETAHSAAPVPQIGGDGPPLTDVLEHLSSREQEIAFAVAEGNTNREVAEDLVISVRTVEYHVGNILQKLDLESRKELRQLLRAASVEQRA